MVGGAVRLVREAPPGDHGYMATQTAPAVTSELGTAAAVTSRFGVPAPAVTSGLGVAASPATSRLRVHARAAASRFSPAGARRRPQVGGLVPGIALVLVVAAAATALARVVPVVGGPVLGIVLGLIVATVRRPGRALAPGIAFSSRRVLQAAVVVLGTQLSLGQIARTGLESLPVLLGTLTACLLAAVVLGRMLGIRTNLRTLIGVGTGICGASAIAAASPVIAAEDVDVAFSISTIFLFNVAAVLLFPIVGHALGLSQHAFGLFAGTAVNDTSSVVAAATTYGSAAAHSAVIVKLTRTLMIIPICLGLAARRGGAASASTARAHPRGVALAARLVPGFLLGFLALAAADTAGLIPASAHAGLGDAATILITIALAGVGLSIDLAAMRRTGSRPIALGAALWIVVSVTSLVLQALTTGL
jgi:uncharacterized integral membrane protein (TIGR00698 family)